MPSKLNEWFDKIVEEYPFTDDSQTPGPVGAQPSAPTDKDVATGVQVDTHNTEPAPAQGGSFKSGGKPSKIAVPKNKTVDMTGPSSTGQDQRKNMTIEPGTISSAGGQFSAKMTSVLPNISNARAGQTALDLASGAAAARKAGREPGIYVDGVKQAPQDTDKVNGLGPKDQGDGATTNLAPGRKAKGIYVPTAMDQSPDNWEMVPGTGNPQKPQKPGQPSPQPQKPVNMDKASDALSNVLDKNLGNDTADSKKKEKPIPDEANESVDCALSSIVESWK